ncbi:heme b synthase [Methanosarcinales archaeon]|nr:MAG: heme b synthase [Methanosarcinales archaeon]
MTAETKGKVKDPEGVKPRLIAWEITGACNLKCKHCRGSSTETPDPDELSTDEAFHLIDEIVDFAKPILILSGGEPLMRKDVCEIAQYGTDKGLRVVLATNGTAMTADVAHRLRDAGIARISVSIDGADAETHDAFRGMPGAFDGAIRGTSEIRAAGISLQINTTISKKNIDQIPKILDLSIGLGADALHIFMLVPTGRGREEDEIPPDEYERILNWFYDQRNTAGIQLKATCAPHYFRIMRQRAKEEGTTVSVATHGFEAMTKGCLAGTGFCFISRNGGVYPCGYLPVLAGNIRDAGFKDVWDHAKVFEDLRDESRLKGKCGICGYKRVCGGCRARAYAATGDYLAEEPYCTYNPRQVRTAAQGGEGAKDDV